MTHNPQNIVLLGATKGMGRAIARSLAGSGASLFLLGRNEEEIAKSAQDLMARGSSRVGRGHCDLTKPDTFASAIASAKQFLGDIDTVVITAGMFATQDVLAQDKKLSQQLLDCNFTGTVLFCEYAKEVLLARGGGSLVVFSSVAGERGRKPVILYGAAKAGLTQYLEGLDHKHKKDGLHVLTVKPGFVKTSMTEGLSTPPFAGTAEQVARDVKKALRKQKATVYTPWPWKYVMWVIRLLPRFIMRRINF